MSAGHSSWNVASAPWQPTYIAAAFAGTSKLQDGQSYSLCPVGAAPHSLLPHSLKPRPVLEYICGSGLCLVFVLPHIMCLALTTRGPPSDVSMCRSLRLIRMLSRESCVELWLSDLLKLSWEKLKGLLMQHDLMSLWT